MISRGDFLRRMAAGTAMVAVPPSVVRLLEAPEPVEEVAPAEWRPPWLRPPLVREWWIESGEDTVLVAQLNDPVRRINLETHFIPPRGALHVEFPPGREYPFEGLALRVKRQHPDDDRYHEMPLLPLGPQSGATRAVIGHAAGLEVYGGILAVYA